MKRNLVRIAVVLLLAVLLIPLCGQLLPTATAAKEQSSAEIKKEIEKMEQELEVIEDEITDPVTWYLGFGIPIALFEKYSKIANIRIRSR